MSSGAGGDLPASAPDVSVVVNAHREGVLAHPTFRSLARACRRASDAGIRVEVVVVVDRPDDATKAYIASLEDEAVFDDDTVLRVIAVDHGDLGLSRNSGMQVARGLVAGVLDADNLVSENWLVDGLAAVRANPQAVVHPAWIVGFGERRTLWPTITTDDPRFRPELLRTHNYWDAFSLAQRSTYLQTPWTASGAGRGPEDWHWNMETVAAGVRHVSAPGTALFYRVKGADSLMNQHVAAGHLLAPAPLLMSRDLAVSVVERREGAPALPDPVASADDLPHLLRAALTAPAEPYVDVTEGEGDDDFDPTHYRRMHADLRTMDDEELVRHWETFGRNEGRRAWLTRDEAEALASWRPEHYLLLNPDLAVLDGAEDLLAHFLQHGFSEGRRGTVTSVELNAAAHLRVEDYLEANPDLAGLTTDQALAHWIQHGRGRPTRLPPEPPEWLLDRWREVSGLDPALPVPTTQVLETYSTFGNAPDQDPPPSFDAWWDAVAGLDLDAGRLGLLLVVDRLDEDGLREHLAAIGALHPETTACVLITCDVPGAPEVEDDVLRTTRVVRLGASPAYRSLDRFARARLVAELVVQIGPSVAHLWGRGPAFDAFAWHAAAMTQRTVIHLTVDGDGLDGELSHPLLGRHPGVLAPAATVWVDSWNTVDRLWEIARLPRSAFTERPPTDRLTEVLRTSYGGAGSDPLHARPETAELLASTTPVALVVTGYEGFANLGDILQAKNLSRFWRSRGVVPVHVINAGPIRSVPDLHACIADVGSPHVVVRGWGHEGPPRGLEVVRVGDVTPGAILHIGGGGYLNRHWHQQRMRDLTTVRAWARPRGLVVSGVQIDEAPLEGLADLFTRLPPAVMGARDERSRTLLERACRTVPVLPSFDDATEVIDDWDAADATSLGAGPPSGDHRATRVGLHLNTSDYAADRSVLGVVNAALGRLREEDPSTRLTVLHAYDDDRDEVADSLESLSRLRAQFVFDRFDVVDLARAARTLDLDHAHVPSLAPLRELDLAIVASYHCAVLLGLLGVPTHLLATNPFYEDKAAGLGQRASLDEFLADPQRHGIDLTQARERRRSWLEALDRGLAAMSVDSPRPPTR